MYNAANNASSQLATSIGAEDTSLAVLDGSSFPEPPFVVSIEDEIIEVGAKDGNTFSALVRGTEGTTPASHASGSRVENRFTAGTYQRVVSELDAHMAESAYWIRVDNLSAPLYIGDSSYQNKAIVPMNVSNSENKIFAIRFANAATLATNQKQIVIMEGNMSPTGRVIDIWTGGTLRDIRPSSAYSMAFYMSATEGVYIHAIYLVKDMGV